VAGGPGIVKPDNFPNLGFSTRKPIQLSSAVFQRFYIAVRKKDSVAAGDESCSFSVFPGVVGAGKGQSCSLADFAPNATSGIDWCEPYQPPIPAGFIALTVLAACFVAALVFIYLHIQSKRRAARLMCIEAEEQFRDSLSRRSISQVRASRCSPHVIAQCIIHIKSSYTRGRLIYARLNQTRQRNLFKAPALL